MTPHSVGGSLNELGEARGTVLAVKLDRQEKGRINHQLGRGYTHETWRIDTPKWCSHICKVIHFPKHHFWVSYGIHVDFGGCSSLWPFQRLLYCGWPQTIKLVCFESVHIATRIFRLGLCCFIWHHDSCITPLSRKVQELWVFFTNSF